MRGDPFGDGLIVWMDACPGWGSFAVVVFFLTRNYEIDHSFLIY